jgi:hypothetical protein
VQIDTICCRKRLLSASRGDAILPVVSFEPGGENSSCIKKRARLTIGIVNDRKSESISAAVVVDMLSISSELCNCACLPELARIALPSLFEPAESTTLPAGMIAEREELSDALALVLERDAE